MGKSTYFNVAAFHKKLNLLSLQIEHRTISFMFNSNHFMNPVVLGL